MSPQAKTPPPILKHHIDAKTRVWDKGAIPQNRMAGGESGASSNELVAIPSSRAFGLDDARYNLRSRGRKRVSADPRPKQASPVETDTAGGRVRLEHAGNREEGKGVVSHTPTSNPQSGPKTGDGAAVEAAEAAKDARSPDLDLESLDQSIADVGPG